MKIIHLVSNKVWGGGEQYVLDLAAEQQRQGHDVTVITRDFPEVTRRYADAGLRTARMPLRGVIDIISPVRLSKLLRKEKGTTIIHVHNFKDATVASRARRLTPGADIRIVMTRHLAIPAKTGKVLTAIYADLDALIFVSRFAADTFLSTSPDIDHKKIHIVHNSTTMSLTSQADVAAKDKDERLTVMFHGRIVPEKGVDTLIEAIPSVRRNVQFRIVGTGKPEYEALLRRKAADIDADSRITWEGHVGNVGSLIATADIGVMPSHCKESFGLAAIEYMAHGKPVVTSDNGAQPEYLTSGVEGLLVPPADPVALAAAINRLADDAALRRQTGAAARRRFDSELAFPRFYQSIDTIYRSLCRHES